MRSICCGEHKQKKKNVKLLSKFGYPSKPTLRKVLGASDLGERGSQGHSEDLQKRGEEVALVKGVMGCVTAVGAPASFPRRPSETRSGTHRSQGPLLHWRPLLLGPQPPRPPCTPTSGAFRQGILGL